MIMVSKHGTIVELLIGPSDDHVLEPGETFHVNVAVLPQNNFPNALTQLFLYLGPRGGNKQVYKLINTTPGIDPDVRKFDFEYTVPHDIKCARNNNAILEFGWGEELQYTWDDAIKRFQKKGQEHNLLLTLPVAQPARVKYDFKVDLCTPMPEFVVAGDALALDLATLLQNNFPGAISQLFVYIKDESGAFDVCCIQNKVPRENPPLLRGGIAYHISKDLVGQTLEIGWASDLQYSFQDAVNNFNKNPRGHLLGHIKVVAPDDPNAEKARFQALSGSTTPKSTSRKMQDYVVKYFSDTGERAKDLAKDLAKYGTKYAAQEGLKMGARRLLAAEVAKATMKQTALAGGRRAAVVAVGGARGMRAAAGFATGLKAVKCTNPAALASLPGELIGGYAGGQLGKALGSETAGKNLGGLAGAMAAGAALGSVVPGAGTAAGAVAGAVSWASGKAIEGIFSLF